MARYLLAHGLEGLAACVCLGSNGEKLVLLREGGAVVRLDRCGVAPEARFVFFDHIHTTGTDIATIPHARAALTVSKDLTFRDLAQGAYRMRGSRLT